MPTLRLTGTDGPLATTSNDRQHPCQQTVNETTRAATKGNDATPNLTEVVKIKSDQENTRVCDGLRTDAKGDEKAGEEDRTPDIQLGNGGQPITVGLENKAFAERASTSASTPIRLPSDLKGVIDAWAHLPHAIRAGILATVHAARDSTV
jgi:hypothetical protein